MNAERDIKVGLDCGDDREELQPSCMKCPSQKELVIAALKSIENYPELNKVNTNIDCRFTIMATVEAMVRAGYRK